MAQYKYPQFLQKNEHAEFDTDYSQVLAHRTRASINAWAVAAK